MACLGCLIQHSLYQYLSDVELDTLSFNDGWLEALMEVYLRRRVQGAEHTIRVL